MELSLNPLLPGIPTYSTANYSHSIPIRVFWEMKEIILLELLLLARLSFILFLKKGETNKCGRNVSGIIIVINILEHT